jgi:beta-phosphoglucomutase-like phosphatase (HAD superfamily)
MIMRHLRLVALDMDGVLLNDTFSPVIHRFVVSRGGHYTADLERAVLSRPRLEAAAALGMDGAPEDVVAAYFLERQRYLEDHPVRVHDGVGRLLELLRVLDVRVICYGGLGRAHFEAYLEPYAEYFDEPTYVCTNDIRPGIREITRDIFGLRYDQALFIDDVASVAEAAHRLGAAFIGYPTAYEHSFQEQLMREAGVRHIVRSLDAIDEELLHRIDGEAAASFR